MQPWMKRDRLTEEQVENKIVPGWAKSMVDNYRYLASIPDSVSNWDLFAVIEAEELCLFEDEDNKEFLREHFHVE